LVLVALSVIEQRYRAVMAVMDGAAVTEVAAEAGVSRQSVHAWVRRYRAAGLVGLADRSHRTVSCPHRASAQVEAVVCDLRRAHPKWGALRIVHELMRGPAPPERLPSRSTVNRILVRHGLVVPRARRKKRSDYVRWQRPAAMQLWQLDIVYGPRLVDTVTGEVREARIVTGVDDHSRFCVLARVVERATARAVCLAFSEALQRYGTPEEVLTDNGKQFTARFGRGGEVLFDRICRRNGIAHRLTQPSSPTTTGKIERFHQTLQLELLDDAQPFTSLLQAQAALDDWVREYNASRPHQGLEARQPVTPAERFQPEPAEQRELLPIWLPAGLTAVPEPTGVPTVERAIDAGAAPPAADGGPVEFDRVVPPSGNMWIAQRQFWLGSARAGQTVRFWASVDVIHLSIAGARVKSLRSHWSAADLTQLRERAQFRPARRRCQRSSAVTAARSRSTAASPTPASSASPATSCSPPKSCAAARSRSGSNPRPCCSSTRTRASSCAPAPTRSPPSRCCGCAARARPARRHGPGPSRSPSSAASPRQGGSPSAASRCRSGACAPAASSPCTCPSTRLRSSSTARSAPSGAPPAGPSSSSRAAVARTRPGPGQRQRNSRAVRDRKRSIPNRSRS
jgi:transposase InsO family protein